MPSQTEQIMTDEDGNQYIKLEPTDDGYARMSQAFREAIDRHLDTLKRTRDSIEVHDRVIDIIKLNESIREIHRYLTAKHYEHPFAEPFVPA